MTQDLNKGISTIQYNSLNLSSLMDKKSPVAEARNEYTYSASGQKLRVVSRWNTTYNKAPIIGSAINTSLLTTSKTTDYVGNKIYENGVLKRILIDGGYIEASKYHYYQTDHLGNNRVVADNTGAIVQSTHYYPFGMAFAEGTGEGKQPYKYNGKELDAQRGLNTYDYSARYMDPGIGRFSSVDPLAEKYYSWSPYVYVGNNPMKYVDPDGRQVGYPIPNTGYWTGVYGSSVARKEMYSEANHSRIVREAATYTDVNDALVIATTITGATGVTEYGGTNANGTPATTFDKIAGGLGLAFPIVSGSAVKKVVQKLIGPIGDAGAQVVKQLPKKMQVNSKTTKNGQGTIFKDPDNPSGNNVRVQEGNPNSPNPAQQKPYVKETKDGKIIDKKGKPTESNSPESHIPKDEYKYKK